MGLFSEMDFFFLPICMIKYSSKMYGLLGMVFYKQSVLVSLLVENIPNIQYTMPTTTLTIFFYMAVFRAQTSPTWLASTCRSSTADTSRQSDCSTLTHTRAQWHTIPPWNSVLCSCCSHSPAKDRFYCSAWHYRSKGKSSYSVNTASKMLLLLALEGGLGNKGWVCAQTLT